MWCCCWLPSEYVRKWRRGQPNKQPAVTYFEINSNTHSYSSFPIIEAHPKAGNRRIPAYFQFSLLSLQIHKDFTKLSPFILLSILFLFICLSYLNSCPSHQKLLWVDSVWTCVSEILSQYPKVMWVSVLFSYCCIDTEPAMCLVTMCLCSLNSCCGSCFGVQFWACSAKGWLSGLGQLQGRTQERYVITTIPR